jgi:hypothetical protein
MDLDLFLSNNVWGDDFGPHARRRSVREKLARGVGPSDGEHLDEVRELRTVPSSAAGGHDCSCLFLTA